MAYISTETRGFGATIMTAMAATADAVFNFLTDVSNARARMAQVERMQRMSDEELMKTYRITREEIVFHVFHDKMMI